MRIGEGWKKLDFFQFLLYIDEWMRKGLKLLFFRLGEWRLVRDERDLI
jgi:hypothetical protein